MPAAFPRRKRQLLLTVGFGLVFLGGTALLVWRLTRPEPIYRPGEAIEGLTTELARTLPDDYPRVRFVDVAEEAGIRFRHFSGSRSSQLPEDMGSGAAWGDYDNDGWLDLYVANMAGPLTMTAEEVEWSPAHSVLYHNNGDGTFTEVSAQAGVRFRGWAMGVGWGDYDSSRRTARTPSTATTAMARSRSAPRRRDSGGSDVSGQAPRGETISGTVTSTST
jgi:hypothetical protein